MSITTLLLPGVRLHPNGRSWQVRISPFPPRAGFKTPDEANEYAVELGKLKRQGILVPPTTKSLRLTTLGDVAQLHLQRLAEIGGRNGVPYSDDGMKEARKACRPWTGEEIKAKQVKGGVRTAPPAVDDRGIAFHLLPLSALSAPPVETYLQTRARLTPRAACGEHQHLQSILKLAARRGELFDYGLLALVAPKRRTRKRKGLPADQLDYMIPRAPEHQRRLLRLGRTLGNRIMELLQSEDGWFDLEQQTVTIPGWACKERRVKTLDLLPEEVAIVREQRLARASGPTLGRGGTPLTFPRKGGTAWAQHSAYWNRVVVPMRRKAAADWRLEHGLHVDADTPFEWKVVDEHGRPVIELDGTQKIGGWQPHDLRRGAATLLRQLGIDDDLIAARLGHADHGELVASTYADDDRRERLRAELDAIVADGGVDARLAARKAAGGSR